MPASLAEMLQPVEVTSLRSAEVSVLLRLIAVIAIGAALLFAIGTVLVGTGALTDFSGAPAEIAAAADAS